MPLKRDVVYSLKELEDLVMYAEGWRRLWELTKWLTSIGIGFWIASSSALDIQTQAAKAGATPGQVLFGLLFVAAVPGATTFALLSALEWVYRGFRPLSVSEPGTEFHKVEKEQAKTDVPYALPAPMPAPEPQAETLSGQLKSSQGIQVATASPADGASPSSKL